MDELLRIFGEVDDEEVRRYLILVLGYTRDPAVAPVLVEALDDADSQTRIYLLWALGTAGDGSAIPPLVEALADGDPGIRKTAAFAVGELGDPSLADRLLPLLEDPEADVRWNAALAVSRLRSDAGVPELERMLDRRLTSAVPGITAEQQQETMISAINALAAVRGDAALPLLRTLAEEDPSLKVRQAAIEAQKALGQAGG
jgi:HEAT repeat protein